MTLTYRSIPSKLIQARQTTLFSGKCGSESITVHGVFGVSQRQHDGRLAFWATPPPPPRSTDINPWALVVAPPVPLEPPSCCFGLTVIPPMGRFPCSVVVISTCWFCVGEGRSCCRPPYLTPEGKIFEYLWLYRVRAAPNGVRTGLMVRKFSPPHSSLHPSYYFSSLLWTP